MNDKYDEEILAEIKKQSKEWVVYSGYETYSRDYILDEWGNDIVMTNIFRGMWNGLVEFKKKRAKKK